MTFNTHLAAVALTAAVAGGGAALLLTPAIGMAQEDPQDTQDTQDTQTDDSAPEAPSKRRAEGECGPGRHGVAFRLTAAAEAIGVDVSDLMAAVRDGQTIAEVAEAIGVDPADVVAAMVADAEEHLASAVEGGRLDQERADEIVADLEGRITELVNEGPPFGGPPPGGPLGPGDDTDAPAEDGSEPTSLRI